MMATMQPFLIKTGELYRMSVAKQVTRNFFDEKLGEQQIRLGELRSGTTFMVFDLGYTA
jgi:hypothetical protein